MNAPRVQAAAALFLIAQPLRGADQEKNQYTKVQCGLDTVVVFEGKSSPDGRYSLGWTIRANTQDAKPVDWSQLESKGASFNDDYDCDRMGTKGSTYKLVDGVIDNLDLSFKVLPTDYTNDMRVTHGWSAGVTWLNSKYAVVTIDSRFNTSDVFLITLGTESVKVKNLIAEANQIVGKLIEQKRPLARAMGIVYDGSEINEKSGLITFRFFAGQPKGSFEDFEGHLIVKLEEGNPMIAVTEAIADNPFTRELGEADAQLNKVYNSLRNKLTGDPLKKCKLEQISWIEDRNSSACGEAAEKIPFFQESATEDQYREARDRKASELTKARVSVLRNQLDSLDQE